jgi:hypothetical protein
MTAAKTGSAGWFSVAAFLLQMALATPAAAQADFSGLQLKTGDTVWVTRSSGATLSGTLTGVSATTLTVDGQTVPYEPGLRLARAGDSLWNGFLIGAAFGALSGSTIAAEACLDSPLWHCAVGGALGFGAVGAFIDWRRQGRTIVFEAPARVSIVPFIAPDHKELGVVLSF